MKAPVLGCQTVQNKTPAAISPEEQQACDKGFPTLPKGTKMFRQGVDESYETFEEELGPSRADPPPQKPVRQICRPETIATRKIREEMSSAPQLLGAETKTSFKQPNFPSEPSLHKNFQTPTQIETPWENVTLNRCLFVAITILVLTSGIQRLHATLRGQSTEEEEEVGLRVTQSSTLRHRSQQPEPETSLWEVMFWWLPDFDDEDDEEEEEENDKQDNRRGSNKKAQASRSFRNKPLPEKNLMKQTHGKLKDRRAKKVKDKKDKDKRERERNKELEEVSNDEIEGDNEEK
ncbi:hypothetical protein Q5P01_022354 [Channa striata]|uniref:Uncharacterized protein n=1 Tax=Channa striata TaxID=64152 RepID=A0AA88IX27_CHASR|nr:hypothetical protein Q5P01_022354 [Channa striata]